MFRAFLCPSSGATTALAASGLPPELDDSSAVVRGRAGCYCVVLNYLSLCIFNCFMMAVY
jgi:hypothetical protein